MTDAKSKDQRKDAHATLPPEFDAAFYRRTYPDLRDIADRDLEAHYQRFGITEGRTGSSGASRSEFMSLLEKPESILEIGPLANPCARGPHVSYFDVLATDALRKKAAANGLDPKKCPDIDFVSDTGDLAVITAMFDAVFSSHAIEHQPDLVRHLQGVGNILNPHGLYYLAIPDKRYCFDHFLAETSVANVLDAHLRGAQRHDVANIIKHLAFTTHNDSMRHWQGDHADAKYKSGLGPIRNALTTYLGNPGTYLDTHAWQFTPAAFREIIQTLHDLGLSPLRPVRVYETVFGSLEFYAVLEKTTETVIPVFEPLPSDFDDEEYLLANPDVQAAGIGARTHYLTCGRREQRKLRPAP